MDSNDQNTQAVQTTWAPETKRTCKRLLVVMFIAWCIGDLLLMFMMDIHRDVVRTGYELGIPMRSGGEPNYPLWVFIPALCIMWRPKWRADTAITIRRMLIDIR